MRARRCVICLERLDPPRWSLCAACGAAWDREWHGSAIDAMAWAVRRARRLAKKERGQ